MPRRRAWTPLDVFMNGRLVGHLRRHSNGAIDFAYDHAWLAWANAIPVSLSLPLREERYIGNPMLAVFENLLPDNDDIRKRLAERVGAAGADAYSLLAAIGRDCVGALQFLPEGSAPGPVGGGEGRLLQDKDIAAILKDLGRAPLGVDERGKFRISLAGAQEKTALLRWRGRWRLPHGTAATTHILKPAIGVLRNGMDLSRSIENEHLCMHLLAAFGLPVAKTEIMDFDGTRALVVERFDRRRTKDSRLLRLPQEDCCQALAIPPARKYESQGGPGIAQILELLKASDESETDRRTFLKAQILYWLIGATDGHAKNFSLYLLPGGRFRLTPLYDVMSTQPNMDAGQVPRNRMKLAMAVGDKRHYAVATITPRHFSETAADARIPSESVAAIFEEISAHAGQAIDTAFAQMPAKFPTPLCKSIIGGIRRRLRLVEQAAAKDR